MLFLSPKSREKRSLPKQKRSQAAPRILGPTFARHFRLLTLAFIPMPKSARRALRKNFSGNSTSSLAVFYVEQVALNHHVYVIGLKARPPFLT